MDSGPNSTAFLSTPVPPGGPDSLAAIRPESSIGRARCHRTLPTVRGGENEFAEFDGADGIAAAVLDRYSRVAREPAEEPETCAPVMEVDRADGDLPAHGRNAGSDRAFRRGWI